MAETLTIRTASSTEVVKIASVGPQGPKGDKGDPGDVAGLPLSTLGDTLYRGASENQRLPIGTSGQILKVSAGGIPEWGAAPATGVTSVALASSDLTITGSPITSSGTITANVAVNALTLNKLEQISTAHFLGRHSAHGGDVQPVSATQARTILNVADGAEANVQSNWTEADSGSDAFILNKPSTFAPSAHASSHFTAGSDPLAPSDIGAQSLFVGQNLDINASVITLTAARAKTFYLTNFFGASEIRLPETGATEGDVFKFVWGTGSPAVPIKQSVSPFTTLATIGGSSSPLSFIRNLGVWSRVDVDFHEHPAAAITSGTLDIARVPTGTTSTTVALGDHSHELDELDATGATNGHVLTADGSNGASWQAAAGGGVTGAAASASDVLGVSGSDITGVDATADRIVFWDDSASALKYLEVSTGLSLSGTTLTATASGGTKTYAVFSAEHNQPPSTAFATLDTRNSIAVLDYDAATDENAVFVGIMPEAASLGSGLIVRLHWMATTATSGNVRWGVQFERSNTDLDADSFDTAVEATAAANGTSGILTTTAITVTTIDGITAGDVFRLKVFRNADDATNDTMTGDAELVAIEVRSAA